MNIYIINESTVISDEQIHETVPALIVYSRHIRTWWGTMQPGIIFGKPAIDRAWQIVIVDDADQAGALGYHDLTSDGRPISYIFAKTAQDHGYDWQITLTHELAEMIMDPYIMRCEQTGDARFHALELCDPVEDDSLGYQISAGGFPPVNVSNFITPYWFVPDATGTFDHQKKCTKPLEVLKGGYAYYWEDGQWWAEDNLGNKMNTEEFAAKHPEKHRLLQYARSR